jgi:hypothetical protein
MAMVRAQPATAVVSVDAETRKIEVAGDAA